MPYGTIKVDNITFTDNSVDKTVSLSGLIQNPTFTGNVTVTGTISGDVIRGGTTISGVTVTGTTANFVSGVFTTQVSGVTITGTTVAATTGNFTSLTGTTTTGTTANFVSGVFTTQISGTTITGTTVATTTGSFVSLTGTTATFTSGIIASGTAALPSLAILSDPNTGIYSPGADQLAVATNGSQRLLIDSGGITSANGGVFSGDVTSYGVQGLALTFNSNNSEIRACRSGGNYSNLLFFTPGANSSGVQAERVRITSEGLVGIGTSGPLELLHVNNASAANTRIRLTNATTGTGSFDGLDLSCGSTGTAALIQWEQQPFQIFTNNGSAVDPRLTITAAGLVGIGTTSPGAALEINAAAATSPFIAKINTSEAARIDSSGRLLVGTSSARTSASHTGSLQLEGTSFSTSTFSIISDANDSTGSYIHLGKARGGSIGSTTIAQSGDTLGQIHFTGSDGTNLINGAYITAVVDGTPGANDMPGRLVFSTTADGGSSPTERMRITNGGAITCGPQVSGADLVGTEACGFVADGVYAPVYKIKSSLTSDKNAALFFNGNGQVGSILMNGSSTAYNTSSDYRLKENVVPVPDGITRLLQLKPSRFNFIVDPTKTVDGFIAHEAQAVVPECVSGEKDAVDDDGNPVYQGIDQSKLVPLLTAALQEAVAEIKSLKARVAALESV